MCGGDHVRAVTGRRQAGNRRAVDDSDSEGVSVVRKDCRRSGLIPVVSFVKGNPEPVKCRPDSKSPDIKLAIVNRISCPHCMYTSYYRQQSYLI